MATEEALTRWAKSSVWPGKGYPAAFIACLLIGQVVMASNFPLLTHLTASSIYLTMASPDALSGCPKQREATSNRLKGNKNILLGRYPSSGILSMTSRTVERFCIRMALESTSRSPKTIGRQA